MKETKVYVDELPDSCKTCQFRCYGECKNGCDILKTDYSMTQCHIMRGKHKDCPLIDIKTHDREVVKEVCEKIREYLRTQVIYCSGKATELDIMIASAGNQVLEDVKQFLDQIQKE